MTLPSRIGSSVRAIHHGSRGRPVGYSTRYTREVDPLRGICDWLTAGAPGTSTAPEVLVYLGEGIRTAGIPIERVGLFVATMHPSIGGRGFIWTPGQPVDLREVPYDVMASDAFGKSPIMVVARSKTEIRRHLELPDCPRDYPIFEDFANEGVTDYIALPLVFVTGEGHTVTLTTKVKGGFTDAQLDALRNLLKPLARLVEIFALRRTAATLLSTYVGHNSGERILRGHFRRGDIEDIRAVIWFSDLRGFTEMSTTRTPREIIDVLNEVFDCQVLPIHKRGGEVLKFIGDAVLAIFPIVGGEAETTVAERAIDAALEAQKNLRVRNGELGTSLRFGLALHLGEIAYGNIGSVSRLDFTAIGPAVNLASRLEGLAGKLGRPIVLSSEMARLTQRKLETLGEFDLKGVPGKQSAYAPQLPAAEEK